jgi:hypothetical protein
MCLAKKEVLVQFSAAIVLALLMVADFPIGADQGTLKIGNQVFMRMYGKKSGAKKAKERVFRAEVEIKVEEKTEPGYFLNRVPMYGSRTLDQHSTFDIPDGKSIACRPFQEIDQKGQKRGYSWTIKVESVHNDQVRLDVRTKDRGTFTLPDGSTRSQSLILQATKTVKLGEKIKFDLTDESLLGVKATFEGVIEEKVEH